MAHMLKFLTASWRHLCFSEEQKLIFGLLFSLKATVSAMRPGNVDGKMPIDGLQVSCALRWFCSQSARLPRKFVGSGLHANRNGKAQCNSVRHSLTCLTHVCACVYMCRAMRHQHTGCTTLKPRQAYVSSSSPIQTVLFASLSILCHTCTHSQQYVLYEYFS